MRDLVPVERERLGELERVVERGLRTFVEVGLALLEIRERRLYRETHASFDAYCRERFGFSDSRGRQLIAAARTVTAVTAQGLPAPSTEREARDLARRLRAQADALDGGGERVALIERCRECLKLADEEVRLEVRLFLTEALLARAELEGDRPDDPDRREMEREIEELLAEAYAAALDEDMP